MIKLAKDQDGYLRVNLHLNGKIIRRGVHQLVAIAYVPNDDPINKVVINHRDGNKLNNSPDNLEWVTWRENEAHAVIHGLKARGERNCQTRLTEAAALVIKQRLKRAKIRGVQAGDGSGDTLSRIAADYGVSKTALYLIRHGKSWRYVNSDASLLQDVEGSIHEEAQGSGS
jgi:hypothetical protein